MADMDMLTRARSRLMVREPFYGHMAMQMEWISSQMEWIPEEERRMGFRIVGSGTIQCLYYKPWTEEQTLEVLYGYIQHGIEHLVRMHILRQGSREPDGWRDATDMVVNGPENEPRIGYRRRDGRGRILPRDDMIFCPDKFPKDESAEKYYELIDQESSGGPGQGQGQCQGQGEGEGEGQGEGQGEGYGQSVDNHSTWSQSTVSEDEARQVIYNAVQQAADKSQGHVPGHLLDAIKALAKPIIRWRQLLRKYLGRHVGNKRLTFSRRNRRNDAFGIKGISHHAAACVSVVVDTSGSISNKELEQFFAEINMIASHAKIFVLQWDHAFQGFGLYRRGDWKDYEVHGRGGTDMSAPIEWLCEHKTVGDVCVMLTDGECNWAEPKSFPMITVITTKAEGPGWGHEVYIDDVI